MAKFHFEAMAWIRRRRTGKKLRQYTEAAEHLEWPDLPEMAERENNLSLDNRYLPGLSHLNRRRPSSFRLGSKRPLLATGRYADEEEAAQKAMAEAITKTATGKQG